MAVSAGSATLVGNAVYSNTASSGGGVYLDYTPSVLRNNVITGNVAVNGGGMYLGSSDATLSENVIADNRVTGNGGGLFIDLCDSKLANNVVIRNQADAVGSGMCIRGSTPRLLHTTVARNSGGDGSGLFVTESGGTHSTVSMTNTILVSHTVAISVMAGSNVTVNAILWDGGTPVTVSYAVAATVTVQNQYVGDPNLAVDGYHLTLTSAAVDRGVDSGLATDIDGDSRPLPLGGRYDLGVDEFPVKCVYLPLVVRNY